MTSRPLAANQPIILTHYDVVSKLINLTPSFLMSVVRHTAECVSHFVEFIKSVNASYAPLISETTVVASCSIHGRRATMQCKN